MNTEGIMLLSYLRTQGTLPTDIHDCISDIYLGIVLFSICIHPLYISGHNERFTHAKRQPPLSALFLYLLPLVKRKLYSHL